MPIEIYLPAVCDELLRTPWYGWEGTQNRFSQVQI